MQAVPDLSSVRLTLELSFKSRAGDRSLDVEMLATDDLGNSQGPDLAGALHVER